MECTLDECLPSGSEFLAFSESHEATECHWQPDDKSGGQLQMGTLVVVGIAYEGAHN